MEANLSKVIHHYYGTDHLVGLLACIQENVVGANLGKVIQHYYGTDHLVGLLVYKKMWGEPQQGDTALLWH